MTPNGLGLEKASTSQGLELIPAGTLVTLEMGIRPGSVGIESLEKRTAKGDATFLDAVHTVRGGPYNGRKIFDNMLLDGTTAGHVKAGEISRNKLRAIFEAVHGIDPNDNSPTTVARRASATLAGFNGATFLATVDVEGGGKRADGSGNYKDKNVLGKILRVGDANYRRLDQPPPAPIDRPTPPIQPQSGAAAAFGPANAAAATAIVKPHWAE